MRCSECGNQMQPWANGICYTCGRIQYETKRFGAHPSARKRAHQTSTDLPPQAQPAGGGGGGLFLPPWLTQVEPPPPPDHCPVCGQEVPQAQLERHLQIHKRLSAARGRSARLTSRALPPPHKHPEAEPPSISTAAAEPDEAPLRTQRRGINRLLADIYGGPRFLSDILRAGGISQADITRIYEERLTDFLDALLAAWRVAFTGELIAGSWYILTRCYGLDGAPGASIPYLAQALNVSEPRVIEIRNLALRVLRAPASRSNLEGLTVAVAREISCRITELDFVRLQANNRPQKAGDRPGSG